MFNQVQVRFSDKPYSSLSGVIPSFVFLLAREKKWMRAEKSGILKFRFLTSIETKKISI
jgi:hypothetical protein